MTIDTTVKPAIKFNKGTLSGNEVVSVNFKDTYLNSQTGNLEPVINLDYDIVDALPHGSGIDADWQVSVTKRSIRLSNSFHAMDDNGFYDGWADFTVITPRFAMAQHWGDYFQLQFNGRDSAYLNQKHDLRSYLADTINCALSQVFAYQIHE
jgi:hypothetical protein